MGGTCLAPALAGVDGIELLPAGAESTPDFYRSLDAFFYRTGASTEAYGRVVVEAMAAGLPVVAHARGGYAEVMVDGVSGMLIQSQEEAYDAVMRLANDAGLCRSMGEAGKQQALAVHGPEATQREMAFYLRPVKAA
jgi:glycosyltransferase involved in cell wall biosynthesis